MQNIGITLYWHLICSGHKTYLIMARNTLVHWPHYQRSTPDWEKGLIDSITSKQFEKHWNNVTGIIRVGSEQPRVKQTTCSITEDVLELDEIKWFININPGHSKGDELSTISLMSWSNLVFVVSRQILKMLTKKKHSDLLVTNKNGANGLV